MQVIGIQLALDEVVALRLLRPLAKDTKPGSEIYIIDAFTWNLTPQGEDYWSDANQLVKIRVIEEINYLHNPQPRKICQLDNAYTK